MKKNIGTKLMICVFTAFIALTGLLYAVMPKSDFSETEKRYLQTFPSISFESIKDGSFSKKFETFLADQTPMRKFYVSLNAYYEFLKGNNGSNGVYLGKDNYLIEKPFDRDDRLNMNIKRINKFAEDIDIPVTLVSVPSKGFIMSDKLPKNSMEYLDDIYDSKIKELTENKLDYISLIEPFNEKKNDIQIYYRTDHHWTSAGAFLAYNQICLAKGFNTPNTDNYNISSTEGFYGTSYSTSCYTLTKPDNVEIYRNKQTNGKAKVTITEGKKDTESDDMFFESRLLEGDKYVTFLDGNHSLVNIKTGNKGGKLLLIKDSFAHCIAPFFAENYSEIVMVDLRYYKKDLNELIKEEGITEVMFLYSIENLCTSRDIVL